MKGNISHITTKTTLIILIGFMLNTVSAQDDENFWSRVRFGGGFGLAIGNNYTDVTIAPGAIYEFNDYVALGLGLQGSYINQDNFYKAWLYGGSVVGLFSPIEEIQLSAELEQLRVNPEMNDSMLEKAGLVKDGRLLVEKIHHRDDDFELRNNGETIKVKCSYHEDIPRITLTRDGVSTDIVMNTPYTQFCIADVVPGGYPEIVALETSYIVNGHNYDVTVYEIEENP